LDHVTAGELAGGADGLSALINRLTRELADVRRELMLSTQKLGTTRHTLQGRTQELTEARAGLALLLAAMDATWGAVLAKGQFSRALYYNTRFVETWRIPADQLATLDDGALLTLQLAQVKDPAAFLAHIELRKLHPDEPQLTRVEMIDGRIIECHAIPQRVRGRRVGSVTIFRDVTERERLGRAIRVPETGMPGEEAEARTSMY